MADNWCLIESDPAVFTEMIRGFGVKGLEVDELCTLEESEFATLRPIFGLVFLFKWRQGEQPSGTPATDAPIFFAEQMIQNACATQALVNLILNIENKEQHHIVSGQTLDEFKTFCADFDPTSRGLCLSNSDPIRTVHNSFARQQFYEIDMKGGKPEENYHFISYVPIGGKVYELDGLQKTPMEVGTVEEGGDWLDVVRPVIQARIQRYSDDEIHFNLMAVVSDKREKYLRRLEEITTSGMETEDIAAEVCELQQLIDEEEQKAKRHQLDNIRRRHNFVPLIVEILRVLAREGKLVSLVENTIEKNSAKRARAREIAEKLKSKS